MLDKLRLANTKRSKKWDPDNKLDLSFFGNELAGEVGEACNVIKKLERERLGIKGSRATVQNLADELADGIICIDSIARQIDIDLSVAVKKKFNETSEKYGFEERID